MTPMILRNQLLKNNKLAVVASSYKSIGPGKDLNGSPDTIVEYAQNNCSVISSSLNEDKQKTEFLMTIRYS